MSANLSGGNTFQLQVDTDDEPLMEENQETFSFLLTHPVASYTILWLNDPSLVFRPCKDF